MNPFFHHSGLLSIAAVFLLGSCISKHAPVRREVVSRGIGIPEPSAVLFVGNSYSFDVPNRLGKIASRKGKALRIDQVTHGGWPLAQHAQNEETLRKIRDGRWDVVVIQEQSRIPSLPRIRSQAMFPHVRKLADEARAHGAVPVLYQTWGRRDEFLEMNQRVREGYRLAAENADGVAIVPVGDAWEREFLAGRGALLFSPDGSHPSQRGDGISAEVFYEAFFGKNSLVD